MSQLGQLKSQIQSLAQELNNTGGQLSQYHQNLNQQVTQVQSVIGGSAQRKDQEVIAALENANSQVKDAVAALQNASKVSSTYSESL